MTMHRTRSKLSQAKSGAKSESRHWPHHAMETSDALDIEPDTFKSRSSARITASLKASVEYSRRRKGTAFQSAMSVLTFCINQTGHNPSGGRRRVLERAKVTLRTEFGRPTQSAAKARH